MKSSKATAFIEQLTDNHTKVRLNFVNNTETSSGYGMKKRVKSLLKIPQRMKMHLQKFKRRYLFVQKQNNTLHLQKNVNYLRDRVAPEKLSSTACP